MPSDTITVDLTELDGMARRYAGADRIIEDELLAAGGWAAALVEARAKEHLRTHDAIFTGNLINSIAGETRPIAGGIEAVAGTSVPYAEDIERGREPGHWPAEGELLGWMRYRGIPDDVEFLIRRKLFRTGTKARPYLTKALAELRPKISREFAQVPERVLKRLAVAR